MTMIIDREDRASRFLLVSSLALNLFFIGAAGALTARHYIASAAPVAAERPRTAAARIERLAQPLPAADAEKLRAAFRARVQAAEGARETLNGALDGVQAALRADPFDPAQLESAFGRVRAARPAYELAMQQTIIAAAQAMSGEGRHKLAEWPSPRPNTKTQ